VDQGGSFKQCEASFYECYADQSHRGPPTPKNRAVARQLERLVGLLIDLEDLLEFGIGFIFWLIF